MPSPASRRAARLPLSRATWACRRAPASGRGLQISPEQLLECFAPYEDNGDGTMSGVTERSGAMDDDHDEQLLVEGSCSAVSRWRAGAGSSSQGEDEAQRGVDLAQLIEAQVPGRLPQSLRVDGGGLLGQHPGGAAASSASSPHRRADHRARLAVQRRRRCGTRGPSATSSVEHQPCCRATQATDSAVALTSASNHGAPFKCEQPPLRLLVRIDTSGEPPQDPE